MDSLTLPEADATQLEDGSARWSIPGLRLAVDLGKDCLAGQAQRKQAIEQRALQSIPFSAGLLGILVTVVFTGKIPPVANSYGWLFAAAIVLILGIGLALGTLERPDWGYIGIEPKEVMYQYAAEAGERGLLKAVSDEYQRRIETNKKELKRMSSLTVFAVLCALLGLAYGAIMVVQSHPERWSLPIQHETAQSPPAPPAP